MKPRKDSSLLVISMLITNKDESFHGFIDFYVYY